jgi:hypothetical protein
MVIMVNKYPENSYLINVVIPSYSYTLLHSYRYSMSQSSATSGYQLIFIDVYTTT